MPKQTNKIKIVGFFLGPVVFLSVLLLAPSYNADLLKVLALALWMIIWWASEAIPIFTTALLPIIFLPLLGISSVGDATAPYANSIIFLFMGGFLIALGLEKHNLHLRIALNLLKITGGSGNGIILGFMIATTLLSMWISNTATAVMMLPIAISVVRLLITDNGGSEFTKHQKNFALGLMISIAYSANIGGAITLIGTPPNVVMTGYLNELLDYEMSFSKWLAIGIPAGLILLIFTYFLITKWLFPNRITEIEGSEKLINDKLGLLGTFSKPEKLVSFVFGVTALGWIFKNQINDLIGADLLSDAVTAMTGGVLMFMMPIDFKKSRFVLEWQDTTKLPWGILLLFGGGMSLARAMEKVGIIEIMGEFVKNQGQLNTVVIILLTTTIVLFLTELMSNVALITIFIPVIIGIAQGLNLNPLLLVVPATIASSCAFMMPISTPPNAIVFSSGHIKMGDMLRAGFILNIFSIILLLLLDLLITEAVF